MEILNKIKRMHNIQSSGYRHRVWGGPTGYKMYGYTMHRAWRCERDSSWSLTCLSISLQHKHITKWLDK